MKARLRQLNVVLAVAIICCLVLHGLQGGFSMAGIADNLASKHLARLLVTLIAAHAGISVYLGVDTARASRAKRGAYAGANARFWAARISGLAIVVLVLLHLHQFMFRGGGLFRLKEFNGVRLAESVLLVLSVALHVLLNAKPLAIKLGLGRPDARALDIVLALAVLLLVMAACFVVYYIRWSVI